MSITIRGLEATDLRFPTSRTAAGTDAMHRDPDYSAAYVVLETNGGLEGHGLTFTIGRGNEICVAAIDAMRHLVVGRRLDDITSDFAGFWRSLASDSQLRWLGPEKGAIHLALAAIVNAVWVGHFLGTNAQAAITVSFPVVFVMLAARAAFYFGTRRYSGYGG